MDFEELPGATSVFLVNVKVTMAVKFDNQCLFVFVNELIQYHELKSH